MVATAMSGPPPARTDRLNVRVWLVTVHSTGKVKRRAFVRHSRQGLPLESTIAGAYGKMLASLRAGIRAGRRRRASVNLSIRRSLSVLAMTLLLTGTLAACGTESQKVEPTVTRVDVAGA